MGRCIFRHHETTQVHSHTRRGRNRYRDRYGTFHLKDVLADRSGDVELGHGVFDFKQFLAAVPALNGKPCYVEQENAADELAAARGNFGYLRQLEF